MRMDSSLPGLGNTTPALLTSSDWPGSASMAEPSATRTRRAGWPLRPLIPLLPSRARKLAAADCVISWPATCTVTLGALSPASTSSDAPSPAEVTPLPAAAGRSYAITTSWAGALNVSPGASAGAFSSQPRKRKTQTTVRAASNASGSNGRSQYESALRTARLRNSGAGAVSCDALGSRGVVSPVPAWRHESAASNRPTRNSRVWSCVATGSMSAAYLR